MCSTATCICGALCTVIAGEVFGRQEPNASWWESWELKRCGVAQTDRGGIMVGLFPLLFGGMAYWRIEPRLLLAAWFVLSELIVMLIGLKNRSILPD